MLGIDTAGTTLSVGLWEAGRQPIDIRIATPYQHSRLLVAVIKDVMAQAGCSLESLDLIGVSRGPGSYTGLRLGAMAAKVLAWSAAIPIAGVDALAVIAHNVPTGIAVACLPARRGQIYVRAYGPPGGGQDHSRRRPLSPLLEGLVETVLEELVSTLPQEPLVLVGEGWREIAPVARQMFGGRGQLVEPELDQPLGSTVARLATYAASAGDAQAAIEFTPLYAGPEVVKG